MPLPPGAHCLWSGRPHSRREAGCPPSLPWLRPRGTACMLFPASVLLQPDSPVPCSCCGGTRCAWPSAFQLRGPSFETSHLSAHRPLSLPAQCGLPDSRARERLQEPSPVPESDDSIPHQSPGREKAGRLRRPRLPGNSPDTAGSSEMSSCCTYSC